MNLYNRINDLPANIFDVHFFTVQMPGFFIISLRVLRDLAVQQIYHCLRARARERMMVAINSMPSTNTSNTSTVPY